MQEVDLFTYLGCSKKADNRRTKEDTRTRIQKVQETSVEIYFQPGQSRAKKKITLVLNIFYSLVETLWKNKSN
jgi:hypothetical protein